MTDPQNPGGWPDAARPGVPQNPERDGWHWLQWVGLFPADTLGHTNPVARYWEKDGWWDGSMHRHARYWQQGWRYVAPCLTPAEVAARVEETVQRIAEICGELSLGAGNLVQHRATFPAFADEPPQVVVVPPEKVEGIYESIWVRLRDSPEYRPLKMAQERAERAETAMAAARRDGIEAERLRAALQAWLDADDAGDGHACIHAIAAARAALAAKEPGHE